MIVRHGRRVTDVRRCPSYGSAPGSVDERVASANLKIIDRISQGKTVAFQYDPVRLNVF
ncbi:hypothetical protein ACCUM_1640 [Candidatus Accumulibacter phosphatis]|uniref:Uncharacterized protein n=1 Tax=Candidatus Accumulibacter phosphatis TaxID=327160 RepID=A0A5S4ESH2_9PROT|nr:hypothetical protein ACCUM_1640 [Candidatus Accumulibacter phosphatis]